MNLPLYASVRAVISDVDGTLLRSDGTLSSVTVAAIERLHGRGIPLVIATARTPAGLVPLEPIAPYVAAVVCCNGAIGHDLSAGRMRWFDALDAEATRRIVAIIDREITDAGIGAYDGKEWLLDEAYIRYRLRLPNGPVRRAARAEIASSAACTIAVRHPLLTSAEIRRRLEQAGIGPDLATLSFAAADVLDITRPDTDKASGVRRTLRLLGISAQDTVAFGDAPNDLPLFALSGWGVAVANAHPQVLAAAAHIADSNDHDGVAKALDSIHARCEL
jgi:Cof subfamily protein (haloacid dehalogenase superfamily)